MKFSIILPVRNGMPFVKECVASILAQSNADFELIVLDNCSSDGTLEWIQSINDRPISIYKSEQPLSIEENWARIAKVVKADYMTIIGHDDVLRTDYLAVIEQLIQEQPKASLYQTHFNYINSTGKEIRKCQAMPAIMRPAEVLHAFLTGTMDIMGTGFMMRSRDFDRMGGMPPYPNLLFADMELWIRLASLSYLAVSSKELFSYRKHSGATTSISNEVNAFHAFDKFVIFLEQLKATDPGLDAIIVSDAPVLLNQYCQGITHKLLRTPVKKRQLPPVSTIIRRFREYGLRLTGNNGYEPLQNKAVRLGQWIDSNAISRKLFLVFKKLFRKPVM